MCVVATQVGMEEEEGSDSPSKTSWKPEKKFTQQDYLVRKVSFIFAKRTDCLHPADCISVGICEANSY